MAATLSPLTERSVDIVRHVLLIGFILLVSWTARVVLDLWLRAHLKRFRIDTDDNLLARKHVTQMRILLRVADTAIIVVALGAVMMTFEGIRQYGVSLLASAGAAGIVVGLALQPVLKNLFAGIQLAITQPIRIDDAVIVEGEWGNVEEITSTYVVVRIWDLRRLIVPLSYFIEKPFQNWTREEANLLGVVMIYLDYRAPVEAIRREVERIVRGSRLWDGNTVAVQVTDFREQVMELRVLASARNAGDAFTLRCIVREAIVAWLQENHPEALPHLRIVDAQSETGRPTQRRTSHEHSQSPA
ncbi:mechanosensitive ion channel family protein [Aquibium microcysteis]|uniref:mechanosensitive ion channel family protein n=1 Tax=Aquibium microcysteis TaxID=675281 RepID=UPI001EF3267A|nr:mechanosensitive ion channel family protein [Aquibium microcysteis]